LVYRPLRLRGADGRFLTRLGDPFMEGAEKLLLRAKKRVVGGETRLLSDIGSEKGGVELVPRGKTCLACMAAKKTSRGVPACDPFYWIKKTLSTR